MVVGVDGSRLSLSAVRLAAREAALHGRVLRIVHAFNWTADPNLPMPASELRAESERLTDEAVACARSAEPDLPVTSAILEGPPLTLLLRESAAAGLLAIGDGGLGPLRPAWTSTRPPCRSPPGRGAPCWSSARRPRRRGRWWSASTARRVREAALDFALDAAARRGTR